MERSIAAAKRHDRENELLAEIGIITDDFEKWEVSQFGWDLDFED